MSEQETVRVRWVGGLRDGKDGQEPVSLCKERLHVNDLDVVKVFVPYPKRKGGKTVERLVVYSLDYDREDALDGDGYIYRLRPGDEGAEAG